MPGRGPAPNPNSRRSRTAPLPKTVIAAEPLADPIGPDLRLRLEKTGTSRRAQLQADTPAGRQMLQKIYSKNEKSEFTII